MRVTHPRALDEVPGEAPRRVTLERGSGPRSQLVEDGTFEGTEADAEALADLYGVDADDLRPSIEEQAAAAVQDTNDSDTTTDTEDV